jgi:lambda family phage portal protein
MAARRTWVDRLVGYFSPARGLRRQVARELLTRAYEGASRTDGWRPVRAGASANTDHAMDARELRVRARALVQNVPYVAQGMRSLVANVIGTGITPTWAGQRADVLNSAWKRWVDECDADMRLNMTGLQAAAYRAMQTDGEVFIRLRPRQRGDGLTVPLQLQMLEADYLDTTKNAELSNGGRITLGIETDAIGRPVGYWMYDDHPGDGLRAMVPRSRRIDAADIIHLFTPERPGQSRGFTRLAPVIARVRDLQLYEDAELNRKNLETRLSVLQSGSIDLLGDQHELEGLGNRGQNTRDVGSLPSGAIVDVPMGSSLTVVQPQAMPGYTDYVKHQLHLIAAGMGVTYEMMTGDVREVNFSSARVRMLDFRREAEVEQWTIIVPRLCDRICRAFEDAAVLAGIVPRATYQVYHSTPKWAYVDPSKDVQADLAEISGGLSSISEKLRQRGYNPTDVFQELARDVEMLKELGLFDALAVMRSKSVSQITAAEAVQGD